MRAWIRDNRTPGRYEVIAYVGRKRESTNTWSRRRDAEENARDVLALGYSHKHGASYTQVEVVDHINRMLIFKMTAPRKRYG